jgi:hypothetical protein
MEAGLCPLLTTSSICSCRIAVFSVTVLHDERIVIVAEQRPDSTEEDSFQWMSRVLQVACLCLKLLSTSGFLIHYRIVAQPLPTIPLHICPYSVV